MKKTLQKMTTVLLAVILCANITIPHAFAATDVVYNNDGTTTVITSTTDVTSDAKGNSTIVVVIEQNTTGETDSGTEIDRDETRTETTKTDRNGNLLKFDWVEAGSETKSDTVSDSGDDSDPSISVELVPGKSTSNSVSEEKTKGDIQKGENDKKYDYTVTTETERTLTADTSEKRTSINDTESGILGEESTGLVGVAPVYDETDEIKYRTDGRIDDSSGKDGLFDRNFMQNKSTVDPETAPEGGEFCFVGTGEHSKYYVGFVKVIYQKDENGNTVYDEEGNPIIEKLENSAGGEITIDGERARELVPEYEFDSFSGSRAQTFMLSDKDGNKVFAYCCDLQTGAVNGNWYSISNLEDSNYYASEESEEHIRSIATNGYWGASDIPKEDGSYETGSLESIKAKLREAVKNGEIPSVISVPLRDTSTDGAGKIQTDENGNPIIASEMNVLDIIDGLTEGEALLATQAAIWTFANGSRGALSGIDGGVVVTPDWYRNHQIGYSGTEGEHLTDEAGARVSCFYNWLIELDTEQNSTTVINEANFVEDLYMTVHNKVSDHTANQDDDNTNDVYNTDLNFKLAFIPGAKDDLLVQITYTDLDGTPVNVIKRLAGENSENQSYEDIKPEADGSYVLKGLKLSENEDFAFDLRLEGTQYLENGVYIYSPVGGRDVSQTFVGLAEGERNVDVSVGVTVSFDVDEDNHIVAKHHWRDEGSYHPQNRPQKPTDTPDELPPQEFPDEIPPQDNNDESLSGPPSDEPPLLDTPGEEPPPVDAPEENDPDVDIFEGDLPPADVPQDDVPRTGDTSAIWLILTVLSGISILALVIAGKKRDISE